MAAILFVQISSNHCIQMTTTNLKSVSVDDERLLDEFIRQQLARVADVDGSLLLVACQHPDLDTSILKINVFEV